MFSSIGFKPIAHLSLKLTQPSPINLALCKKLKIITGLKTFNSKWPLLPPIPMVTSLPITCAAIMVNASHCVGFTLPGIMLLPGSLSGIYNSPIPLLGPLDNILTSLAIFIKLTATVFKAPWASTIASCAANASNLFSAVTKGKPVSVAICFATTTS